LTRWAEKRPSSPSISPVSSIQRSSTRPRSGSAKASKRHHSPALAIAWGPAMSEASTPTASW
jgi:hypothetical protein